MSDSTSNTTGNKVPSIQDEHSQDQQLITDIVCSFLAMSKPNQVKFVKMIKKKAEHWGEETNDSTPKEAE